MKTVEQTIERRYEPIKLKGRTLPSITEIYGKMETWCLNGKTDVKKRVREINILATVPGSTIYGLERVFEERKKESPSNTFPGGFPMEIGLRGISIFIEYQKIILAHNISRKLANLIW